MNGENGEKKVLQMSFKQMNTCQELYVCECELQVLPLLSLAHHWYWTLMHAFWWMQFAIWQVVCSEKRAREGDTLCFPVSADSSGGEWMGHRVKRTHTLKCHQQSIIGDVSSILSVTRPRQARKASAAAAVCRCACLLTLELATNWANRQTPTPHWSSHPLGQMEIASEQERKKEKESKTPLRCSASSWAAIGATAQVLTMP